MNQNEQMRKALRLADAVIRSWIPVSYNRQKIDERAQALNAIEQALAAEPDAEPALDVFGLNAQIAELKTSNAKLRRIAERGAEFEAQIIKAKAQLVPEIADAHRTLAKWLNEEVGAPIDRYALAKVLAATQCLAVKECVTTEPAQREPGGTMTPDRAAYFMRRFKAEEKLLGPNEQAAIDLVIAMLTDPKQPAQKLVRLTKGEINCIAYQTIDTGRVKAEQVNNFAKAIMDAMIAKNGGKHD